MMKVQAKNLKVGDLVDLENDPYGKCDDPDCGHNIMYEYEYGRVAEVNVQDHVVEVDFANGDLIFFPPWHEVTKA